MCRGPDPEVGSGSASKSIRLVIFRYYRVLAVGLIFAGGSGGMAKPEKEKEERVEQTQETPSPRGSFSRGRGQREYERRQEERGQEQEVEQEAERGQRGRKDRGRVVAEGRDWRVVETIRNGRKYFNLKLYPSERGVFQILKEEAGAIMEVAKKLDAMISYTVFTGNKRVVLLIGEAGVVIQIPKPILISKLKWLKALLE